MWGGGTVHLQFDFMFFGIWFETRLISPLFDGYAENTYEKR